MSVGMSNVCRSLILKANEDVKRDISESVYISM